VPIRGVLRELCLCLLKSSASGSHWQLLLAVLLFEPELVEASSAGPESSASLSPPAAWARLRQEAFGLPVACKQLLWSSHCLSSPRASSC